MASKKKICSCGRMISFTETCSCKKNKYSKKLQKQCYEKNNKTMKLLSSARWKKLRTLIIKRDKGLCQRCFIKYGIINGEDLQVHHIKPRVKYPELMFEESNLITLCRTCNLQLGTNEKLDFEPDIELDNYDFDFKL